MVGGKAWLGWALGAPPGPADLVRATTIGGYEVRLGDGNTWAVPTGRLADGSCNLEQGLILGADGKWARGTVIPSQARLWQLAQRVWDVFAAQQGIVTPASEAADAPGISEDDMPALCCELLAVNYRVGPDEISALHLLTTTNRVLILWAVADIPGFIRMAEEKKSAESKKAGPPAPDG
jgi:hypothetical protein